MICSVYTLSTMSCCRFAYMPSVSVVSRLFLFFLNADAGLGRPPPDWQLSTFSELEAGAHITRSDRLPRSITPLRNELELRYVLAPPALNSDHTVLCELLY